MEAEEELDPFGFDTVDLTPFDDNGPDWRPKTTDDDIDDGSHIDVYDIQGRKKRGRVIARDTNTGAVRFEIDGEEHILGFDYELVDPLGDDFELATIDGKGTRIKVKDLSDDQILAFLEDRRRSLKEIKEARATDGGAYYSKMREGFALKKEAEKRGIYKKPTTDTKPVAETVTELDPKDIADAATLIDTQQGLNRTRPSVQRAVASNKEAKSQSALRTRLKDLRRSKNTPQFLGKVAFISRGQAQKLVDQFGGESGFIDETKMAIRSNQSLFPGVIKNKGTLQNEGRLVETIKVSDRKGKLTLGADDLDIIKSYIEEGANAIPILLDPSVPYTQEIAKIDEYSDEILDFYLPDGSKLQYDKRSWSNTFGAEEKVVKKKTKGPAVPTKPTPQYGPFGDDLGGKVIGTENVPDFALGYAKEILEKLNMEENINIFFYTDKDTQKNGKIKAEVLEKHNVQPRLSRKAFIRREAKRLNMTTYELYIGRNEDALTKIKEQYEKYREDYILDSGADDVYGFVNQFGPQALENHTYKIFVNTSNTRGERAKIFPGIQNAELQRSTEDISILNTVAHEVGHILEWELFNNANDVEKVAVLRDYYAYLSEGNKKQNLEFNKSNVSRKLTQMFESPAYKEGTSRTIVGLRNIKRGQGLRDSGNATYLLKDGTLDVDSLVLDLNRFSNFEFKQNRIDNKIVDKDLGIGKYGANYQLSFAEWFAEQTARWSMERIPPKTMSEKFFKRVSEIWEKIFATTKAAPGFKFLMDNRASNKLWRTKFINQRAPPAKRPLFSDNNPVGFKNFTPFKGEQALRAKFDEDVIEEAIDKLRDSYEVETENLLYIPNMRMWPFRIKEVEFLENYRPEDSNAGIMTNSEINLSDESDPRVIKALDTNMGGGPLSLGTEGRAEYIARRNLNDKNDNTADIIVKNVPVDWVLAQTSSWGYIGGGARRKPLGKWKLTDSQQMNVDELTISMMEKGFFDEQPSFITINSKSHNTKRQKHINVMVSEGNHRALAAKAAGLKVMPVQFKWFRGAEESMNDTSDYKSNFTLDDLKELIQPKISIEIENSSEADMMLEAGLPISKIIEDPEIVEAVTESVERTEAEAKVIVDEMTEEEKLAELAEPIVPDEDGVESDSSDGDGTSDKKAPKKWKVNFLKWVQSPLKLWSMRNPDGTYVYPQVRKVIEKFQFNTQSVTSKMSRIFKRYNDVWRKVPEAERADVSAIIVEGDRQGKKYSLAELQEGIVIGDKTIKLTKEGIDGYNETRNTLDELGTLINEHNDNIRPKATKRLNDLLADVKETFDSLETPEFKGVTKVEIVERIKDPKTKKIVGYVVALPNGWSMKFTAKDFPGVDIKNGKQLENLIMESDGVKAAQAQAAAKAKADFEAERAEINIIESLKEREEIYNELKRVYRTPKLRNAEKAKLREENINRLNERIREIEKEIGYKRGYKGSNPYQLKLNRQIVMIDIENSRIKPEFDIKTNDGYLPHIWFGSHSVRIVSADGKVKNIFSEQGYFDTDAQARQAAENFIEANPKYKDDKIVVVNRGTTWADSAVSATTLNDKTIEKLAVSLTADQLEDVRTGRQSLAQINRDLNVKMGDRRVTASFEKERLGAEGYSTDTQKILGSHIQNVMRFLILDEMKYDANEIQQALDDGKYSSVDKLMKDEFRNFINDISNVEGGFENTFDSVFDSFFNTVDNSIDTLTKGKVKGLDRATLYSGMTGLGAAGVVGIFGAPVIGLIIGVPLGMMVYGRVKASSDAGIVSEDGSTKVFDPTIQAILGISAHTKLGMFMNLLSPIVNLSQTVINTSALYSYSEIVQSFGILSRYTRGKMTGTDTEFTTMWDQRFDEGGVDVDQGLFTDGTEMNLDRGTIAKYSMFLFQKAEVFNRMMAYTAGHTRATNNGKTEKS